MKVEFSVRYIKKLLVPSESSMLKMSEMYIFCTCFMIAVGE